MKIFCFVVLLYTLSLALVVPEAQAAEKNVEIQLNIASDGETASLSATAFGMSLAAWVSENEDSESLSEGIYPLTADALYSAFSSQIQIWRELQAKGKSPYAYLDELTRVDDEGYLREYIWRFHQLSEWGELPPDLEMEAFSAWAKDNISRHEARLEAQLRISSQ